MGILAAIIIAILITLIFSPYKKGELGSLLIFFFVLFLSALAAQFWIVPFGPVLWGVTWLPIVFIVFIFALLFSTPPPTAKLKAELSPGEVATSANAVSIFVWLLFSLLLLAIVLGVYYSEIAEEKSVQKSEIMHRK